MFLIVLNLMFGCQSYRTAMGVICNAPTNCKKCTTSNDYERRSQLVAHIDSKLKNNKARKLLGSMPSMDEDQRTKILNEESRKLGMKSCPLATELQESK